MSAGNRFRVPVWTWHRHPGIRATCRVPRVHPAAKRAVTGTILLHNAFLLHGSDPYAFSPPAKRVLCDVWAQRLQSEGIRTRALQMCRKFSLVSKLWNEAFSLKHTTYTKGPWAVMLNEMAVVASGFNSAGGCCCRGWCTSQCPNRRWTDGGDGGLGVDGRGGPRTHDEMGGLVRFN